MPKFQHHACALAIPEEEVVKQFIDSGIFIVIRRKIRSMCMISRSHPDTPRFYKSHASCRSEEIRHLVKDYYTIHPFSKFNLYWEFYMFFVLVAYYVNTPIAASIDTMYLNDSNFYFGLTLDILHAADIIKIFFTGYYDEEKSKAILHQSAIAKNYLKSYFFIDVFSCVNLILLLEKRMELVSVSRSIEFSVRILDRLKIFRVFRWLTALELFRKYMGYSNYLFKAIRMILVFIVVIFWAFSIHFFVKNFLVLLTPVARYDDWDNRNITRSYYEATLMLLLISCTVVNLEESLEYLNLIFFLCFGVTLQLFLYAQVLQVWIKYTSAEHKHSSLQKQFKEYMEFNEMPVSLRQRFQIYFDFKFHKYFFKESEINNMVSPLLKQEIHLHVTRRHIESVDFFKHLPENILVKVVSHMKSEIYLPGDVIITAGEVGTSMFFIYNGTVAIYTPSGREICHLEDGAHFGEIALILSETRVATVVAISPSELFILKRSDFLSVIEPFPLVRERLVDLATVRMQGAILASQKE